MLFSRRHVRSVVFVVALQLSAELASAGPLTITTLAGPTGGMGSVDGAGSTARFHNPQGIAVDANGNAYVADTDNHLIRRVSPAGLVSTVAGTSGFPGSVDGSRPVARFNRPTGLALDGSGNLFVTDSGNHTIRMITPAGVVTTVAGQPGIPGTADGSGAAAQFRSPSGIAADNSGNLYVADTANHTIRLVTAGGTVTTLAGFRTVAGGADGTGTAARFNSPAGVAVNAAGELFVADSTNHMIRKVTASGVVTTFAGLGGVVGTVDGTGSAARFNRPAGITLGSGGDLYVAEVFGMTIRKISPQAVVSTHAGLAATPGTADGTGAAARFNRPIYLGADASGNLFVSDLLNQTIRRVTLAGEVSTLAGLPATSGSGDGTGNAAQFNGPFGVAPDAAGNVFVADLRNHTIRRITPAGVVTTFAGLAGTSGSANGTGSAARFNSPRGIAVDGAGNVFVSELNHAIRKITPAGVVTTFAGLAGTRGTADGTGSVARFDGPGGISTDGAGNVYVADQSNHTIRKITPAGVVTTLAGLANSSGAVDGTGSAARFRFPDDVAVDANGTVYVADGNNHTIRMITPAGVVTTLAGLAGMMGSADGSGSEARFNLPNGIAVDSAGEIYVADTTNQLIRKVTPAGSVFTVAGLAGVIGTEDGTGSVARLNTPRDIAASSSGMFYVADTENHRIRIGTLALSDTATIDLAAGAPGVTRQLSGSAQGATTFLWTIVRRPATSTAALSSTTVSNPTFTPDAAGVYTFQLDAAGTGTRSITTVDLVVAAPGVSGDANGDGRVSVADIFYLVNTLFTGGPAPIGPADPNGDTRVSVADIFYLVNFLFVGGPAPV